MFTQCPECATVFEIEIEDLKAADGKVCCGECDRVFNALASLTDEPPDLDEEAAGREAGSGEEAAEAHRSGDLFPDEPDEADEDSADEEAETRAETADEEIPGEDDAPEQDWEPDAEAAVEDEESLWARKLEELGLVDDATGQHEIPDDADDDDAGADEGGVAPQEQGADWPGDWLQAEPRGRRDWLWAVGAALAGLALIGQAVHYWREDLARVPTLEPLIGGLYESLGKPLPARWNVADYVVRKGAVSDHPEVAGTLLVNAIIGNEGGRAQPRPLLKVTLLDRWGEAIGERFFAPAEYLAVAETAGELMEPGETLQASVLIVDPGQGAVSYGIDACLRNGLNQLECAHRDDF